MQAGEPGRAKEIDTERDLRERVKELDPAPFLLARSVASSFYQHGLEAGFEDYRQYVEDLAAWRGPIRTQE